MTSATTTEEKFHQLVVVAVQDFLTCVQDHTLLYCATTISSNEGEESSCKKVRLGLSVYYVHMQRWLSVYSREQLMVIRLEDWLSNFEETMEEVWSFIGVGSSQKLVKEVVNTNMWRDKFGRGFRMLPKTRQLLREFYSPYNIMLAQLLNEPNYLKWNED